MSDQEKIAIESKTKSIKPESPQQEPKKKRDGLYHTLHRLGNRAVRGFLAQRKGGDAYQLDDETAGRINNARGGGAPLENRLQMQMSEHLGYDLSGVRVHTSSESDRFNRQLNAKAFTTGQDIFFRSGAYNPATSGGKELIAHELTHVVQQGSGQVQNGEGMTVNAPGDRFEQEADRTAREMQQSPAPAVQMQEDPEEEEALQMQEIPEEEEELQMQDIPEEEESLQMSSEGDEEEEILEP